MFGGNFLPLPVHAGSLAIVDLHAIHADVALPCRIAGGIYLARIAGDDAREGDEAAAILGPALQDGKIENAEIFAQDDFFAGRIFGGDKFGEEFSHLGEHGEHADFIEEAFGGAEIHELANAIGNIIERVDAEGEAHAALAAKLIHENFGAGIAFDIFKQQGGTAGGVSGRAEFGDAIGDLRYLQNGVHFHLDTLEFPMFFECLDPFAQIAVCQVSRLPVARCGSSRVPFSS